LSSVPVPPRSPILLPLICPIRGGRKCDTRPNSPSLNIEPAEHSGSHDETAKPRALALPLAWCHGDRSDVAVIHFAVRYQPAGVAKSYGNRLRFHPALRPAAAADLADSGRDNSRIRPGTFDRYSACGFGRQLARTQSCALSDTGRHTVDSESRDRADHLG